jgi:hypothetical protein
MLKSRAVDGDDDAEVGHIECAPAGVLEDEGIGRGVHGEVDLRRGRGLARGGVDGERDGDAAGEDDGDRDRERDADDGTGRSRPSGRCR